MNFSVVYIIPIALSVSMRISSSAQVAGVATLPRFLIFSKGAIALEGGLTAGNSDVTSMAATTLFGPVVVSAAGSMVSPAQGLAFGSYGASADVAQWIHLGVAHWDSAGVSHLQVPLGLTLPFAWCLRSDRAWLVWVGGRRDFQRVAPRSQSAYSDDACAYTLGLTVETSARFGFQVALDRTSRSDEDWSVSAGVHLGLRTLPKGTRTTSFSDTSTFKSNRPCGSLPAELTGP